MQFLCQDSYDNNLAKPHILPDICARLNRPLSLISQRFVITTADCLRCLGALNRYALIKCTLRSHQLRA